MADSKEWSRRDFLKVAGGSALAVGLLYVSIPQLQGEKGIARAANSGALTEWPVLWLQTGTCTGCSVSVLNSLSPRIQNVLVDEVVPGNHISLRYHMTVMATAGDSAIKVLRDTAKSLKGGYVLVVEGAPSTKDGGVYDQFGIEDDHEVSALTWTQDLGRDALAVIALGTCAVGGGIPAAKPNPTGCVAVQKVFADAGITTPVINVPGCPPHPDWFVGTVATVLVGGLAAVEVDEQGRPKAFFGELIHHNCPRYSYFERGQFSTKFSDPYCMYQLGCKGPITHADCPKRLWNSATNWCVGANSLCHGCAEPGFPDFADLPDVSSSIRKKPEEWEVLPLEEQKKKGMSPVVAGLVGAVAGAAAGAAVVGGGAYVVTKAKGRGSAESQEEKKEQ
jgi:hydrogenase small subunit